jgi:oxygen-independent coproporphyrinogen-3 oxidase
MFRLVHHTLADANGYQHYEISNFSMPGRSCRHNLKYWNLEDVLGFGLGAHSSARQEEGFVRSWNTTNIQGYIKETRQLALHEPKSWYASFNDGRREVLDPHEELTDFCHTSLRLKTGINIDAARKRFSALVPSLLIKRAQLGVARGHLTVNGQIIRPTLEGWLFSNRLFLDFTFLAGDLEG